MEDEDDLQPEYDFSKLREVRPRGYYAAWYAAGPVTMPGEPPTDDDIRPEYSLSALRPAGARGKYAARANARHPSLWRRWWLRLRAQARRVLHRPV